MKFKQTAVRGPTGSGRLPVTARNQLLLKPLYVTLERRENQITNKVILFSYNTKFS